MFTAHLQLKAGKVAYRNRNIFVHEHSDLWDGDNCCRSVGVHFAVPEEGGYARNIDLFTPMAWAEVSQWAQGRCGRRGDDYEAFKLRTAEKLIWLVESYLPDLKGNIENVYTSTPLTYRDYTGTYEGSAYGIIKDCGLLVNSSRGIIYADNTENFAKVAGEKAKELQAEMALELAKI